MKQKPTIVVREEAAKGRGADRVVAFETDEGVVIAVADGAGNSAAGGSAAETFAREVRIRWAAHERSATLVSMLTELDELLDRSGTGGETTAILLIVNDSGIRGASVGDSEAWALGTNGIVELTQDQRRKPLLGSGRAAPVPFELDGAVRSLVVGSDGLFKYVARGAIAAALAAEDTPRAADELLHAQRLPSGDRPDDIGFVLFRAQ